MWERGIREEAKGSPILWVSERIRCLNFWRLAISVGIRVISRFTPRFL